MKRFGRILSAAALMTGLSGCTYMVADGGYYQDGYYDYANANCDPQWIDDDYYACEQSSGFVNIGFGGGYYQDYYYPGYGLYQFDRGGRRYELSPDYRRYWGEKRREWRRKHGHGYGQGRGDHDGRGHDGRGHGGRGWDGDRVGRDGRGGRGGDDVGNGYAPGRDTSGNGGGGGAGWSGGGRRPSDVGIPVAQPRPRPDGQSVDAPPAAVRPDRPRPRGEWGAGRPDRGSGAAAPAVMAPRPSRPEGGGGFGRRQIDAATSAPRAAPAPAPMVRTAPPSPPPVQAAPPPAPVVRSAPAPAPAARPAPAPRVEPRPSPVRSDPVQRGGRNDD